MEADALDGSRFAGLSGFEPAGHQRIIHRVGAPQWRPPFPGALINNEAGNSSTLMIRYFFEA